MRVQERRNREMNLNSILMTSQDASMMQMSMKNAVSSSPFAAMLEEEKEIKRYSYELNELKKQIYDAGNILEKSANMKDFQKFRDLIRSLTDKLVKDAYRIRVVSSYMKRGREYQVVSKINEELDSLYRLIMSEQKNHIAIANKVMRLKGLVLDLMS
ncbi:YaaR family protein [uncultured Brachyspira sp.]|uniref:YaaR family protein n=1 Tax=uncultured Brachyspira sp. TaxID=221953 RepID=UPI0025FF03C6|nr:YaaR family protein [uncultured Brachyspira sp.]